MSTLHVKNSELIVNTSKAELHVHLEGSLEPQMMLDLANRNSIQLKYSSLQEIAKSYKFANLQEFLDLYYMGMSVLQTEEDFFNLTYAYLSKAHQNNVTHTEMFFDPQAHLLRGIKLNSIITGIWRAITTAKQKFGIAASLIPNFLRHLSEDDALSTFDLLMEYRNYFIGIGLDSSELGNPPSKFKNLFDRARTEKLKLVCHAGEEGPASYIWEAIDILGVNRIDHGNMAITDETLIKRLAVDKIALTMCPLSNLSLQIVPNFKNYPVRALLNHKILMTINSDDPSYFGGYINDNYHALSKALNLTTEEIQTLINNSMIAKFI